MKFAEMTTQPGIYALLDQRVVRHGKPLYLVIKELAERTEPSLSDPIELLAQVNEVFGTWSADAAQRFQPQTFLAVEHLALMDEIARNHGAEIAAEAETRLQKMVANQFARYMGSSLKAPDKDRLISLGDVKPVNAYTALAQRTALLGFQPHEAIREWMMSKSERFLRLTHPTSDVGYLRLAKEMAGPWPATSGQEEKLQRVTLEFLDGIAKANSPGHAVVVQSALENSFARAIRKAVQEFGLENHLNTRMPSL